VRRIAKPLAWLLICAQLLLAVPAVAMSKVAGNVEAGMPCNGMPMGDGDHCPCCPDGVDSMRDCLASCMLAVAVTPAELTVQVLTPTHYRFIEPCYAAGASTDPPLKPPPIG
jgi:hypothetical protein